MASVHREQSSEQAERKIFPCRASGCRKVYKTAFSRNRHEMVHQPSNWYQCHLCPQRFAVKQYFRDHVIAHAGLHPYRCQEPECGASFNTAGKLARHRNQHKSAQASAKDKIKPGIGFLDNGSLSMQISGLMPQMEKPVLPCEIQTFPMKMVVGQSALEQTRASLPNAPRAVLKVNCPQEKSDKIGELRAIGEIRDLCFFGLGKPQLVKPHEHQDYPGQKLTLEPLFEREEKEQCKAFLFPRPAQTI